MYLELNQRDHGLAILINDRYFYKYSKNRCLTAWCIAEAKIFQPGDVDKCVAICEAETEKGKECYIIPIRVSTYAEHQPDWVVNQPNLKFH
jgi:hypothetical protein